jgi:RNA polymerase sigma-70 factor (ECF subfamily)
MRAMHSPQRPTLPDALLAHEPFVRALAQHLLRSDQVDDLVQETWLAALRHPVRSAGSGRAFLGTVVRNLVRNRRRDASARTHREQAAARADCVESVGVIQERLSVQRAVVDAVLALDEPYRGAILLHYYESLDAAEIAQRRGVPAGTVRAQLSRGLQVLRTKLDSKFGGDRGAWSAVLIPWVGRTAPVVPASGLTGPVLLLGLALLIVSAVPLTWLVVRDRRPQELENGLAGLATPTGSRTSAAAERPENALGQASPAGRDALVPALSSATVSTRPDLDAKSIEELLTLEDRARGAIEKRLCTPDARILAEQREFLALPGTGICRLLRPGGKHWNLTRFEKEDHSRNCFACLIHSVRNHPIEYQPRFRFSIDMAVRSDVDSPDAEPLGLVADIGWIDLLSVPTQATPIPREWSTPCQESWALCWSRQPWLENQGNAEHASAWPVNPDCAALGQQARAMGLIRPIPEQAGETFLNRQVDTRLDASGNPGRDILAAVRVLQSDADGVTLAWRLLRTWTNRVPDSVREPDAHAAIPAAPDPLEALSIEELTALIHDIHVSATARYLRVPAALEFQYAATLSLPGTSLVRLLPEPHELPRLFSPVWAGIDYTFPPVMRGSSWRASPTGESSPRDPRAWYDTRNSGWILDLGNVPLIAVPQTGSPAPSSLDAAHREVWQLMWTEDEEVWGRSGREWPTRVAPVELRTVAAQVGHTYLTRTESSVEPHTSERGSSVLLAFTLVGKDEGGDTLLLKTLRTFSLPQRKVR